MNSDYDGATGQTFELGVQFESNVAGEVTGVLFYKQTRDDRHERRPPLVLERDPAGVGDVHQ